MVVLDGRSCSLFWQEVPSAPFWRIIGPTINAVMTRPAERARNLIIKTTVPFLHIRCGTAVLNQTAYSLYFFIRDIARGDLFRWIDTQLASVKQSGAEVGRIQQDVLVIPMRSIFGVSDKVLTMTLSEILMSAPKSWPRWFEAGSQMIAVDTLVHNFLHRTGILDRFEARHGYGVGCYRPGGCADILRIVSDKIDARRFNSKNPANFPRFIQHALWNYCAADGLSICNGLNIDDRKSCQNIYCIIYSKCSRISLY